ncbi:aconitase X [Salinicola halimionae]|uniref:aconitase X n=1 Tax=Salinicola halimionae TaxID=1949081 RepID=UPI00165EF321|nr:aconitase X [Salinicola halimionae]
MMRRLESLSFYLSAIECPVEGEGSGVVMASSEPLNLWGGVDAREGEVTDRRHPLFGECVAGRALVIPHGGGAWGGSELLLEAIHAGKAPALIVLNRVDDIIALGAIVADEVLSLAVPIIVLDHARFALAQAAHLITFHRGRQLVVSGPRLAGLASVTAGGALGHEPVPTTAANDGFALSPADQRCLSGEAGPAAQVAMRIVVRLARLQGALELLDVTHVHVDGCFYTGPAGLAFAERLVDWGGKAGVPTTVLTTFDKTFDTNFDSTIAPTETAERLIELCRRLGASPVSKAEPALEHAPLPWLLALCVALTGRAPALSAG